MPLGDDAFGPALAMTLKNEGGLADDALDRGGVTMAGITLNTLAAWRAKCGKPVPTKADVVALGQPEVADIYRAFYWKLPGLDRLDDAAKAAAVFDLGVLTGTVRAGKIAQAVANVKQDGALGPVSQAAIAQVPKDRFLLGVCAQANAYFVAIVQSDTTQAKFLPGWTRRVAAYVPLAFAV